jgi:hypothetical protein
VFVERFTRYQQLGADEVIMRLDGNHKQIMRSIELIGKYVIPKFKMPRSVVGPSPLAGPVP